MTGLRAWWARRALRTRITLVVGVVALAALLALGRLGAGLMLDAMLGAADADLGARATSGAERLRSGATALPPPLRVVDTAGVPVDGGPPLRISPMQMRTLASGEPTTGFGPGGPVRWVAAPAVTQQGASRFVLASADLLGGGFLVARALVGFVLGALLVAVVVTATAWLAGRAALGPVDRMRRAAAALGPGERLPLPVARDELHALAGEINAVLDRRDEATARLARFTGDAAHELRSPVASLRAQAEVAVAHPDPELATDTLRAVAHEAQRLSVLVDGLLALARSDAGRRPDARPVDLVAAVRATAARAVGVSGNVASGNVASGNGVPGGDVSGGGVSGNGVRGNGVSGNGEPGGGVSGGDASDGTAPGDGEPGDMPTTAAAGPVVEIVAPVPATVPATPAEVELVVQNLLDNAVRYARGHVVVTVLPAGRGVRLVVDDDGPGIPPADRQRVFDRFTRLEPDASGGSGLGLALVAATVRGRGGRVAAGTAAIGGARFEAWWPPAASAPTG